MNLLLLCYEVLNVHVLQTSAERESYETIISDLKRELERERSENKQEGDRFQFNEQNPTRYRREAMPKCEKESSLSIATKIVFIVTCVFVIILVIVLIGIVIYEWRRKVNIGDARLGLQHMKDQLEMKLMKEQAELKKKLMKEQAKAGELKENEE